MSAPKTPPVPAPPPLSLQTLASQVRAPQALSPKDLVCAAEPIRTPGTIQPHGILLAADPANGMALVAASANAGLLLPNDGTGNGEGSAADILSMSLASLLGDGFVRTLVDARRAGPLSPACPLDTTLDLAGQEWDVACHEHAGVLLIELERPEPGDPAGALRAAREMQRSVAELRDDDGGLEALATTVVKGIRRITGYERVLVYRFDADWNGQAVAEDAVEGWEKPLLGLHFPASDIPSQARALYHDTAMRWVQSRDAVPEPVYALPGRPPLDLSHARLRALSPVHMQYHRNLGVDGTMSVSIMQGKRLWGLVVCHHRQPHRCSPGERAAAAALTDAFALRVGPAEQAGNDRARQAGQHHFNALIAHMAGVDDLHDALTSGPVTVQDVLASPGAAVVEGEEVTLLGQTPDKAAVLDVARWLRAGHLSPGGLYATSTLPAELPGWQHGDVASGLLAISLGTEARDMLLWFRPEEPHTVFWGGDAARDSAEPGPRRSFERWAEVRRGTAHPWAQYEVETATTLRHAITEVVVRSLRRIATLSDQLRQSQKMEAVGQLTGGLAHDFNNILAGITGSLELAQTRLAQGRNGDLERYLAAALTASGRAAALTHRLLAFSRRQTLDPKPTDVNRLISGMEELIRRTVGPAITVERVGLAGIWAVLCDANQLENALLNLAINARDAMPDGGRLTLEAANTRLDDDFAGSFDVPPGHYVAVSVSDTGHGMDAATLARVFEPFFTTKVIGQGTGLGLSMVYGFAKQSGGHARIYSEPGQGTTVRMYLPRFNGEADLAAASPSSHAMDRVTAQVTVLVVDDEPVLRMLVSEVLSEHGVTTLEAADAASALAVLESGQRIDLLLTDVGLPNGMNGRQLVEAARQRRPDMKVLFMTGYAENAALSGGVLDARTQVLTKPFAMGALIAKLRAMTE